jgi:hypothetical protein
LRQTYVRFVTGDVNSESQREAGVFQAAYRLRDAGTLDDYDAAHLTEHLNWFNSHLEKPNRFTAAKPPYYRKKNRAISWFKETATEHITRMWEIIRLLESHGLSVRMIKTDRPGYVTYEDEHQIVAEPFADSGV